jgi:O-Antigen ligase
VLAESLLLGEWRFDWTTWAWVNRFLGWFILLSYGATGALAVVENGKDALRVILLTFVGATAAIAGIEVCLVLLCAADFQFAFQLVAPSQIEGFAQNRNAFALQLLMATAAVFVFARGALLRIALLTLLFAAFWFAGSRSGWIGAVLIAGTSLYFGATTRREILIAALCAVSLALAVPAIYVLAHLDAQSSRSWLRSLHLPAIVPDQVSTNERIVSLLGGLRLFVENPIFGAGLGAFQNQKVLLVGGFPLVIHSTPIWLLAELGIVGFLAFAVPALYVFVSEWRRAWNDQASAVVVLCLVAFAVMSTPADMLYQRTFWLVVGAALAATPLVSHRRTANESTLHS